MATIKTIIAASLLATAILFTLPAASDVTREDIAASIKPGFTHPYLYFTERDKSAILSRIEHDSECRDIMARLSAEGNRLLYTPVDPTPPPFDPHAGFTNDIDWLRYIRNNANAALKLSFLYQMTGDRRYAEKAFEFADVVCDMPSWVDARHRFPIIYSRVWPFNVDDDQAAFAVDLETTDTARILAAVYDWLYTALDKRQRDRIRGALLEKAILPVRGNYEYHWWTSAYRCNWCACCNAGIGTASLALLTEDPELLDVVAESVNRINRQFDEIGIDGGWQEGCGYYRKGVHAVNFFADPLKRLTGGAYNMYSHPKITANPITFLLYFSVTPGRLLPFEDSAYNRAGMSHIWNKLAIETNSPETSWFRNYMFGAGDDIFDILWPRGTVAPRLPGTASKHFRSLDWAVMRTSFTDPDRVVLACKAGMNNDPHHGHLDCGHFLVYWKNLEYIADLGSPPYDELYFDEARWTYPQASSAGHNVILVNGEQQMIAKHKDLPWQDGVGGNILEFRTGDARDYTLMDPTHAYPGKELLGWRRHLVLDKPNTIVVLDEIATEPGAEIEARFHSHADIRIEDGFVLLDGGDGMMAFIPLASAAATIRTGSHASLPVIEGERYESIPYWGTVVKAVSGKTLIGAIVMPVSGKAEAASVAAAARLKRNDDGSVGIVFSKDGSRAAFLFEVTKNGLSLK